MHLYRFQNLALAGQAPVSLDQNLVWVRYSWRYQWTRRTYHNFD